MPLIKSLRRELPAPLPGIDGEPVGLVLPDEDGLPVSLASLRGRLVLITEMPLGDGATRDAAWSALRALRKRLRGLTSVLSFVVLCHGGTPADLTDLLNARSARRPEQPFLLDEGQQQMDRLRRQVSRTDAHILLLDRHGRVRCVSGGDSDEIEHLIQSAGQLANWPGSDPPPAR